MKLPLSVAIIASNEEKNLDRCLSSVVNIASEIIVVVNDCTDRTCEIANSFDAKIYHKPWQGFSIQKNFALKCSTLDWILCLDADEALDTELRDSIMKFILANGQNFVGAYFSRRTFFMNRWIKHGDWSPDYVTRVVKNGYGRWSDNTVHEKLLIEGEVKKLRGHLLHYSFENFKDHMHKNIKYAELSQCSNNMGFWTIVIRSFWKFCRGYFLKLGFLDGRAGLYIACTQALFTMYKYLNATNQ